MEQWIVECDDCGEKWIEVYPEGLDGDESHSDPGCPKTCKCQSQYTLLEKVRH